MSRRVLVTGGAGFIGSHLVEALLGHGDDVSVLDNLSRGRSVWLSSEVRLHEGDIRDDVAVQRVLARSAPDVVVHLAAMHFIPAVDDAPDLARDVNVEGTRVLLKALRAQHVDLLLFASSAAVYPDLEGPIDESCPPGPIDLYGRTKVEGEQVVGAFERETSARLLVARIFNVIGTRETNPHVVPDLIGQLRDGAAKVRVGNLRSRRDYTDVRDVALALQGLVDADATGIFNVGSGRSLSVSDLVRECEGILGRRITVEVDARRVRRTDRAELVADAGRLREATGWQPARSPRDTLAELLAASDNR
jgi:UDP-glucose 4-epimerase